MIDSTGQLDLIDAVSRPGAARRATALPGSGRLLATAARPGARRRPPLAGAQRPGGRRARRRRRRSARLPAGRADVVRGADRRPGRRAAGADAAGRRDQAGPARGRYRELLARRARRSPRYASTPTWSSSTAAAPAAWPRPAPIPRSPRSPPGSGLYGPTLFDAYRAWRPTPAAFFACAVVRRPDAGAGDRARRWLDRLRPGRRQPAAPAVAAGRAETGRHRGRRRGADAAGPARPRPSCASATGCGSGTPRPASCANTSTSCT